MKYDHPDQDPKEHTDVRYALVQKGKKMLFIVGLNPSRADEKKPDPTMRKVVSIAEHNGYDGFVMINLYPLRATKPKNLPKECNLELHKQNLAYIEKYLSGRDQVDVWLAYGNNANRRPYLLSCLKDIVRVFEPHHPQWLYINALTSKGYPRHPLYQKVDKLKALPKENIKC